MELRGAVALVTGGNGGLGQRICHALAKEGVHVAVMYAQSRDQAEGVARELTSSYQINAAAFACDVTDGAAVEHLIGDVTSRLGRIDILVNDAAYNKSISFTDLDNLTLEVWDKIIDVNLTGPMRLTKAVAPVMKAQGRGRIVNIASVLGLAVSKGAVAYAAAKAGVVQVTKALAVELAFKGVRVNAIAPGWFVTEMNDDYLLGEAGTAIKREIPMGRFGNPGDLDGALLLLTSDAGSYITGATIVVDGGQVIQIKG